MVIALTLVATGGIALLIRLGVLSGLMWSYVWPAILIHVGLAILWVRHSRRTWVWGCAGDTAPRRKMRKSGKNRRGGGRADALA